MKWHYTQAELKRMLVDHQYICTICQATHDPAQFCSVGQRMYANYTGRQQRSGSNWIVIILTTLFILSAFVFLTGCGVEQEAGIFDRIEGRVEYVERYATFQDVHIEKTDGTVEVYEATLDYLFVEGEQFEFVIFTAANMDTAPMILMATPIKQAKSVRM